jgi:hypothetical protein
MKKEKKNVSVLREALRLFFALLMIATPLYAQSFKASVDRTTVNVGATFQVYFEFSGDDINSVSNFKAPSFKGFTVLGGPNQSTSMQIINGSVSASLTYSYVLTAEKTGTYTIGSASVYFKGKKYSTNPIVIKVVKGGATATPRRSSNAGVNSVTEQDIARNVFIRAVPDKYTAYQGEQITVTYKLYTRLNISTPTLTKLPTYQGFWAEDLDMPKNIGFHNEMYNGVRFRVANIKKVALFATKAGRLKVTPFELKIPVIVRRRRSRSLFDDFFNDPFFSGTQTYDYNAKSNSLVLDILPLPTENVPKSFTGAVGNFSIAGAIDKYKVKTNEAISLKLKISGTGNINLIDIPEIQLPVGFEKYEPKSSFKINKKGLISGYKSIEYLLVPRIPGRKIIPPVEFSFFNPRTRRYVTLKTQDFIIDVEGSAITASNLPAGFSKEDIKLLNKDIRFIKTSGFEFVKKSDVRGIPSWFYWALVVPTVLLFTIIGVEKRRRKLSGNVELSRSLKAEKIARKRLRIAKKALDSKQSELFYQEIAKALYGYLEDKLRIKTSEFTLEKVENLLKKNNIEESLVHKVKEIADKCEFARFAPEKDKAAEERLYRETLDLISSLESKIKKVTR